MLADRAPVVAAGRTASLVVVLAALLAGSLSFFLVKRREAYATSGPRITLRFFAGWGFDETVTDEREPIAVATEGGVPMGDVLRPGPDETESPTFVVWAAADPLSAPLQRVQIVKGWIDSEG